MRKFCIWGLALLLLSLGPPLFIAGAAAFVHLDASLLNPANWTKVARGAQVIWTIGSVCLMVKAWMSLK